MGVGVPAINQLVGVNAVIYYTPTILKQTGFGNSASILGSVGVGVMNVLLTLIALMLIDRIGRRPLVMVGVGTLTVALAVLGALYLLPSQKGAVGVLIVVGLCVYIAASPPAWGSPSGCSPPRSIPPRCVQGSEPWRPDPLEP